MVPIPLKLVHGVAPPARSPAANVDATGRRLALAPQANKADVTNDTKTLPATPMAEPSPKGESMGYDVSHPVPSSPVPSSNTPKPMPALPTSWAYAYEVVPEMSILGVGAYGTVFQVRHKPTQQLFACKVIQRDFLEVRGMAAQLNAEIHFLQWASLSCRVARLCGTAEENGYVFMLLELCPFGTLDHELCAQPAGYLAEARAARCARHMLQGLMDVHAMGIMHRDIKVDNLLVAADGSVKLADFGWATTAQSRPCGLAGTFTTMAPEVLREEPQTTAADLWSAGAVIFQMVTGRPLLNSNIGAGATQMTHCDPHAATRVRQQTLLDEISKTCPLRHCARPLHVSLACWDLLRKLLEPNSEKRLTAADALQHEWLQDRQFQPVDVSASCQAVDENVSDLSQNADTTITPSSSWHSLLSTTPSSVDDASVAQPVVLKQVLAQVIEQGVEEKIPCSLASRCRLASSLASRRSKLQEVDLQVPFPQTQTVQQIAEEPWIQAFADIVAVPLLKQVRETCKKTSCQRREFPLLQEVHAHQAKLFEDTCQVYPVSI